MAGERKGKTYEAIIKVALDHLKVKKVVAGQVFWNEKAPGMTVTPDFTIGSKVENPTHVLLVTHSGSAKESEKKNWRNLGELAECKLRLKTIPKVFSIAFDSMIKENLKKVGASAFDGQLIVGDKPYGKALTKWVEQNHNSLPKDGDQKAVAIADLVNKKDKALSPLFDSLVDDIETLFALTNPALDSLWKRERARPVGAAPAVRSTSFRRGLTKALLFGSIPPKTLIPISKAPTWARTLGLVTPAIGGARVSDPELIWVASTSLSNVNLSQLLTLGSTPGFRMQLDKVRGLALLSPYRDFLAVNIGALSTYNRDMHLAQLAPIGCGPINSA